MTLSSARVSNLHLLVFLLTVFAVAAPSAQSQFKHEGPAKLIALSQTTAPYDVISIRQNNTDEPSFDLSFHDESLTVHNMPLEYIIQYAYDVPSDRISGLTGPVKDLHFDIEAKVLPADGSKPPESTASQDQAKLILLLQDRFHLKVHIEPKTMPTYDLVVVKGGLKIKLSQDEIHDSNWNINGQDTKVVLTGKADSMADLASALSDEVHRQVVDKTGLTGRADITLKWTDDVAAQQGGPDVVSIFTAIEDQLGLKLRPSKGPVDTLVIDHVEMPTGN